ncbi:tegument protein UL14 [macacine betaherpesvirus 9]|uniref:Tegument protein UL14 n=1 Tax=macacine betaherpesvirus 9 TaxID=2560568 RepID=A0A192XPB9_9BETA|nr:tegument protein UL14 [macacine betaherpesvirus 9]ANC96587.1 tegument protein UL14 [macacine betaherpesvirus 9]
MSFYDLVKQNMSRNLENKHYESLKIKLGENHPLSLHQQIKVINQNIKSDNSEQRHMIGTLTNILKEQQSQLKTQKKTIKQLENIDLEEIFDVSAEVKSLADNIKDTLATTFTSD